MCTRPVALQQYGERSSQLFGLVRAAVVPPCKTPGQARGLWRNVRNSPVAPVLSARTHSLHPSFHQPASELAPTPNPRPKGLAAFLSPLPAVRTPPPNTPAHVRSFLVFAPERTTSWFARQCPVLRPANYLHVLDRLGRQENRRGLPTNPAAGSTGPTPERQFS